MTPQNYLNVSLDSFANWIEDDFVGVNAIIGRFFHVGQL